MAQRRELPASAPVSLGSSPVQDIVEPVKQGPALGIRPHEAPVPRPVEAILPDEAQLGGEAAGVLKPDLVDSAVPGGVAEPGGLGSLVILDLRPLLQGQRHRGLIGDGPGPGLPLAEGQGPVVAVVGDPQVDLLPGDDGDGVVQHLAHIGQRRHRHRRAVGVAPLVWMGVINTYFYGCSLYTALARFRMREHSAENLK